MNIPERGEVWLADCGLAAKVRPVVVISIPFADTDRALITVVPHTTKIVGSAFEVHLPIRWLEKGAFNIQATFPLVPPQFIRKLGTLTREQLGEVESALKQWEGLR
jgi:mRNA interferase MazF